MINRIFRYSLVIVLAFSLGASAPMSQFSFDVQTAEAIKSKGTYLTLINSKQICGDRLCSEIEGGRDAYDESFKNYLLPTDAVPTRGFFDDAVGWVEGAATDAADWTEGAATDAVDWTVGTGKTIFNSQVGQIVTNAAAHMYNDMVASCVGGLDAYGNKVVTNFNNLTSGDKAALQSAALTAAVKLFGTDPSNMALNLQKAIQTEMLKVGVIAACGVFRGGEFSEDDDYTESISEEDLAEFDDLVLRGWLDDTLSVFNTIGDVANCAKGSIFCKSNASDAFRSGDIDDIDSVPHRGWGSDVNSFIVGQSNEVADIFRSGAMDDMESDVPHRGWGSDVNSFIVGQANEVADVFRSGDMDDMESVPTRAMPSWLVELGTMLRSGDVDDMESDVPHRGWGSDVNSFLVGQANEVADVFRSGGLGDIDDEILVTDVEEYSAEDPLGDNFTIDSDDSKAISEATEAANALKKEIAELESQVSAQSGLDQELKDIQAQLEAQNKIFEKRFALMSELKTQHGLNERIKQLQAQLEDADAINKQIASLKELNAKLTSEGSDLKGKFTTLKEEVEQGIAKIKEFTAAEDDKVTQLKEQLAQTITEKKAAQTEAVTLQNQVTDIKKVIFDKSATLKEKEAEKVEKDKAEALEEKMKKIREARAEQYKKQQEILKQKQEAHKKRLEAMQKQREAQMEHRKKVMEQRKCMYFPYQAYNGQWARGGGASFVAWDGSDLKCYHKYASEANCESGARGGGFAWDASNPRGKQCERTMYSKPVVTRGDGIDISTNELADLQNQITELTGTLVNMEITKKAIASLKSDLVDTSQYEEEIKSMEAALVKTSDLEAQITKLSAQIKVQDALKEQIASLNEATSSLKSSITLFNAVIYVMELELTEMPEKQAIAEKLTKENNDAAQAELDEATEGKKEAEARVVELKAELPTLEKQSADLDVKIEAVVAALS